MKATIKTLAIAIVMIIFSTGVNAQQLSAAIVDQHNAAETTNYKLMMLALAGIYAVYMVISMKRKREISRLMGKSK